MINNLIKQALHNRIVTFFVFVVIFVIGWFVIIEKTPVDALPDLSENQVVVMTKWSWQSPLNVEDQITYPITVNMQWLAWVKDIRAMSQLGISMVTIIFEDDIDTYFARDRVAERLNVIQGQLPSNVKPMLWPDATGLGQVFMYTVDSDSHTLTELRSIQDFQVRYILQAVPWVAEVASVWWYEKRFQVIVDPQKLHQYNIPLQIVTMTIKWSSDNISANTLSSDGREIVVQWLGMLDSLDEIKNLVIKIKSDGVPLLVSDVATVRMWWAFRRGVLADAEQEKVGGIVVMRYEENPLEVIDAIKEKITELENSLPEWITITPFYDRTSLIKWAIDTLQNVLVQEIIITALILWIFLWHFGATLAVVVSLVVGMVLTFLFMYLFGIPSNIMSLWGIAIAIWTMVDAAIVVSENIYQHLVWKKITSRRERIPIIKKATLEVGKPIVFAIFIIMLSFIPVFTLTGMEGKLFKPLAYTNIFAMFGALLAALFLVPAMMVYLSEGKLWRDDQLSVVTFLQRGYKKLLLWALHWRKLTLAITAWLVVIGGMIGSQIGTEFMPPLDEWSIMYMPMTIPDVSEEKALEILLQTNKIIWEFPEVATVVGKAGRADTATDPAPLAMIETIITLKPKDERREGITKQKLISQMNWKIRIDNVRNGFTQPIIWRIEMLSTWLKGDVGIKIYGDDPVILESLAIEVEELMWQIPWAMWVVAVRTSWLRYLNIDLQEDLLATYGVDKAEALSAISAWVGWNMVATTIDWRERYGIEVRLKQNFRQNVDDVKSLMLMWKDGSQVVLDTIADITLDEWPAVIASENGIMRSAVQMNVEWRDLVSFVEASQEHLNENLELPDGYFVEWAGQYNNQLRAKQTLSVVVPAVIVLIFFILYLTYKDIGLVGIVWLSIPLSLVGGIIALFIGWFNFSVAVWIWFIVLFGNAVETGVVIMVYLENAYREKFWFPLLEQDVEEVHSAQELPITKDGIYEAIVEWAMRRLRPILMTAFTSIIWLLPMLITTGIWSEIQKPLAVVVVGGLITSVFLTLVILPVLFAYLRERNIVVQST